MSAMQALDDVMIPGISPGVYTADDFRAVSELVYSEAGIVLPSGKAMLVYSRLAPLVRESGCGTFAAYIERMRTDFEMRARTIASLTTNHTFFYREEHHFEHFASRTRPAILRTLQAGGSVRMWSAGCSSGEETWSLVVTLLGEDRAAGRQIASKNIRVLASDIAPHALKKATEATYLSSEVQAVPEPLRKAWIKDAGDNAAIAEEARQLVRFRSLNLLGDWPMKGLFDVIFCRNVMIYFDQPTKERLVSRFADKLVPGGFLYIGHSERVTGPASSLLQPVGPTIYQKRAA